MYDPARRGTSSRSNLGLLAPLGIRDVVPEFPIEHVESRRRERRGSAARAAATRCSIRARRGRTSDGRRRGLAAWRCALRDRHGLTSVVLWGPGEEPLAGEVVAASERRRDPVAATRRIADLVALSRGAALMVSGDTGPGAHRRRRRHADRRHLRADAAVAQRSVVARRCHRVARRGLPVPSSPPLQAADDVPARHPGGRGARGDRASVCAAYS